MTNNTNIFANSINATSNGFNAAFGLASAITAAQANVVAMTKAEAKKTEAFKTAKAENNKKAIIFKTLISGVKSANSGISDADAEEAAISMGGEKPMTDDEIIDTIINADLITKKNEAKANVEETVGEAMGFITGFAAQVAAADLEAQMKMMYAPAPTPAPTPAPVPAPTPVSAPAPAPTITTRKELGNELRSISAAARGDRAMLHADSVEHPFTGNCKKWGASLFQEIADRAYTRSDYWKNK